MVAVADSIVSVRVRWVDSEPEIWRQLALGSSLPLWEVYEVMQGRLGGQMNICTGIPSPIPVRVCGWLTETSSSHCNGDASTATNSGLESDFFSPTVVPSPGHEVSDHAGSPDDRRPQGDTGTAVDLDVANGHR